MVWEPEDGHDHWHIQHAARYSLWSADRAAMVAPAMKVGFCLIDSQHVDSHGPGSRVYTLAANDFCAQGDPQVPSLVEGISAGWRDVYVRSLAFQWVDVSDVQPGTYWLRAEVDPDNWARESSESNAPALCHERLHDPGLRRPHDRRRDHQHHRADADPARDEHVREQSRPGPVPPSPRLRATAG